MIHETLFLFVRNLALCEKTQFHVSDVVDQQFHEKCPDGGIGKGWPNNGFCPVTVCLACDISSLRRCGKTFACFGETWHEPC